MMIPEDGLILNIDKPLGWTSHDVVAKVRGLLKIRKVGHAGTLDPFATGVLLVLVGRATRKQDQLMQGDKEYRVTMLLGRETDSYDRTGKLVRTTGWKQVQRDDLDRILPDFIGDILQVPPMFSALKVKGTRLYKLARAGRNIERQARPVHIESITVEEWQPPRVTLRVQSGKGVYIRSLVHDLGQRLGCGAYALQLTRTRVGEYDLRDAKQLADLTAMALTE